MEFLSLRMLFDATLCLAGHRLVLTLLGVALASSVGRGRWQGVGVGVGWRVLWE